MTERARTDKSQPIERRILDAMVYLVHVRKWRPKVIYLTPEDHAQLPLRNQSSIDGIEVRVGKVSRLYSDSWWGRAI